MVRTGSAWSVQAMCRALLRNKVGVRRGQDYPTYECIYSGEFAATVHMLITDRPGEHT